MEVLNIETESVTKGYSDYIVVIKCDVESVKMNYDVRVEIENLEVKVKNVGYKTRRQHNYKYIQAEVSDNYSYRKLDTAARIEYLMTTIREKVPKEVLNLAIKTLYEKIEPIYFE